MDRMIKRIIAVWLVFVMALVVPLVNVQPAAAAEEDKSEKDSGTKYISEVRIGMGETEAEAKKELEKDGYIILKDDDGKYADLNVDAGSKSALKRGANDKIVYLGYKTTDNPADAVTDLAVMNMEGGYSFEDYEALMQTQLDSQIKPFVDRFIATLNEYRANYKKSKSTLNYKRANYIRLMLNKLTDDDTGGKPMGDLLLQKTKYEMGDEAYNKLSDEEKKNHADILTILMQANGQATLTMESLLAQAADSHKTTWLERFMKVTLADLEDQIEGEETLASHKEVLDALDRKYGDSAKELLKKWKGFQENISQYEDKIEDVVEQSEEIAEKTEEVKGVNILEDSDEEVEAYLDVEGMMSEQAVDIQTVGVGAYLENTEYNGGTLLDFFSQDYEEVSGTKGIRQLYPIVDALSAGQIAGLEFVSIADLFQIALSNARVYDQVEDLVGDGDVTSIYDNVNREIYEKGGVALTNEALRAKALAAETDPQSYSPSALTITLWGVTAGFAIGTIVSKVVSNSLAKASSSLSYFHEASYIDDLVAKNFNSIKGLERVLEKTEQAFAASRLASQSGDKANVMSEAAYDAWKECEKQATERINELENPELYGVDAKGSNLANKLAIGAAVITVIMTALSMYFTFSEAIAFYDVEYAPIPKYIVDEADIITYNEKGEKEMIKNQTAYYKVVECNRTAGDSKITKKNFETMGTRNDLNGDIGTQWLSLYAVKYLGGAPILADSLVYRKGDGKIPDGYSTGIHTFGGKAATNLNNKHYLFRDDPTSVKVFFKTETKTVEQMIGAEEAAKLNGTGSIFGGGSVAMSGGVGLVVGALLGALVMGRRKKKITE